MLNILANIGILIGILIGVVWLIALVAVIALLLKTAIEVVRIYKANKNDDNS